MIPQPIPKNVGFRRKAILAWATLWPCLILLLYFPLQTGTVRVMILLCFAMILAGGTVLAFRSRICFCVAVSTITMITLALLWPARPVDREILRTLFVENLSGFQGTRYIWGGETALGIDCSGLMRRAMIDSILQTAARTGNPGLIRSALNIWWTDCTARELSQEYGGRTTRIDQVSSLNEFDSSELQPGDMAIVSNGIHVLALLEGKRWIEANSGLHRVIIEEIPQESNPWFQSPGIIVRWSMLADPH